MLENRFGAMKHFFFYDHNFAPLRDHMVASLTQCGGADELSLQEDLLDDLKGNNRAGGGMPTYLYKAAKIKKALEEVEEGEVFLFTDVDIQFFKPIRSIVEDCMSSELDMLFQKEFEDIGVNIGFMAMRSTPACHAFWNHVLGEITRTQCLDQRVVNNSLYSGNAAREFGLQWDRWPSSVWCSSMAFSGPVPASIVVHHANFLVEKAPAADPQPKVAQLQQLRDAILRGDGAMDPSWMEFMAAARSSPAMLDYRDRHFGARRPGIEWSTLPEGHIARPGGYSEKAAKRVAAAAVAEAAAKAAVPGAVGTPELGG